MAEPQTSHAFSVRHRVDDILSLARRELTPILRAAIGSGRMAADDVAEEKWDAAHCLKLVRKNAAKLANAARGGARLKSAAHNLLTIRNAHAHDAGSLDDLHLEAASKYAAIIFQWLDCEAAAKRARELRYPPQIRYVAELRALLEEAATQKVMMTYEETLSALGLRHVEKDFNLLYRQLNVLAAEQMLLNEPQLCALVVLSGERIPGPGFYWIVDLERDAPEEQKRERHAGLVQIVWEHHWREAP